MRKFTKVLVYSCKLQVKILTNFKKNNIPSSYSWEIFKFNVSKHLRCSDRTHSSIFINFCRFWKLFKVKFLEFQSFHFTNHSMSVLTWLLTTFPTMLVPYILLSLNSLINVTSRFGSICFSINLFPSSVKVFLIFRPSIVTFSTSLSSENFCWWVLKGMIVFKPYSFSLILTISVEDGMDFANFLLIMFSPEVEKKRSSNV